MNNRRRWLTALGVVALVDTLEVFAQQPGKVWRIGFLSLPSRPTTLDTESFGAFRQGMRDQGYIEGRNLVIEWRFADGDANRLSGLAAELVRLKVDILVAPGIDAPLALQRASSTIPIVMTSAGDPVASGLVKSLAAPGGNITGLSTITGYLGAKRLELLLDIAPKVLRVAVLVNPAGQSSVGGLKNIQDGGQKRKVAILPVEARTSQEIDNAFSLMRKQNAGALIVILHPLFQQQRSQIAELALNQRLPTITADSRDAETGCLMSYGSNLADSYRRAAIYVDRILKGAKPGNIPVEQPTKFDLVINRKTAVVLGLSVPQSLLISAVKVIE
jgi:putative ABC transport system substrate-binding protein